MLTYTLKDVADVYLH